MSNLADLLPAGGGQNNTDFVADGAISSGAPVILTAAGKAAPISESSVTEAVGSEIAFGGSVGLGGAATAYDTTNDKVVIAYGDNNDSGYGKAIVGTVSGASISFGTQVTFAGSGSVGDLSIVFDPDLGKVIIFFRDNGNSGYGTAIVGTVSGTSISFGSAAVFSSSSNNYNSAVYDTSNDKIYNSYTDQGDSNKGKSVVGTVSGTSISFGSAVTFNSSVTFPTASAFDSSANKVVTVFYNTFNGYSDAIVGTVSGTSVSFGSSATFNTGTSGYDMWVSYDVNANKTLISFQNNASSNYGSAIVGTVSGTSISFGTAALFEDSQSTQIQSVYDSSTNKVVIAYQDSGSSSYGTAVNATISGTSVSFTTPFQLVAAGMNPRGMAFDSDNNKIVLAYMNGSSSAARAVVYTPPNTVSNLTSTNLLGIASGAISDTATGTINTWGSRNEVQTGLTIGSDYYVQTNGNIQSPTDLPTYSIGTGALVGDFSVASQETAPSDFAFNTDGTKMYVVGYTNDAVYQYSLSTAFTVSTASYDSVSFSVASQSTRPMGMTFNNDGTKMYIVCRDNDAVYQYSLSSGFDLSTASYDSVSLDVSPQDNQPNSIRFNADGTKMYILGAQYEYVFQYGLSSAFDLSTASYDSVYYDFNAQGTDGSGLTFSPDGTRMSILCDSNNTAFQYSLTSGYDLSTASYDSISLISTDGNPSDIRFSADGTKFFISGRSADKVYQYTTAEVSSTYLIGKAITATQINIKDYTG